jgi:hypothetical protein
MHQICLALPVRMGRGSLARRLIHELEDDRREEHERLERRLGIEKSVWYLADTPLGELLIGYLELESPERAGQLLVRSHDGFGAWLSAGLRDATGIDLHGGERPARAELLGSWGMQTTNLNATAAPQRVR